MFKHAAGYLRDLWRGARAEWGWKNRAVVAGMFADSESGRTQRLCFELLLASGFRRELFQLVFPGQTAGLVKLVPPDSDGRDEFHVRFYSDGTIACEREVRRWSTRHWRGPRTSDHSELHRVLETCDLPAESCERIRALFGDKPYSENWTRFGTPVAS